MRLIRRCSDAMQSYMHSFFFFPFFLFPIYLTIILQSSKHVSSAGGSNKNYTLLIEKLAQYSQYKTPVDVHFSPEGEQFYLLLHCSMLVHGLLRDAPTSCDCQIMK